MRPEGRTEASPTTSADGSKKKCSVDLAPSKGKPRAPVADHGKGTLERQVRVHKGDSTGRRFHWWSEQRKKIPRSLD